MIHVRLDVLRDVAEKRGYAWAEVQACIVEHDVQPGICKVDPDHSAYPHRRHGGPGTELKKALGMLGIHPTKNCSCNSRMAYMDDQGVEWVEANIETVVDWLQQEARKRRLPFFRAVGRMLVNRAIKRSRGIGK